SYYDNSDFTGLVATHVDPTINFNWSNIAPLPGMGRDTYSVRWTGQIQPPTSDTYTFTVPTNNAVRLWVDDLLVIDNWDSPSPDANSGMINLDATQKYDIRLEFRDDYTPGSLALMWNAPGQPPQNVPTTQLAPAANPARVIKEIYVDVQNPLANDNNVGTAAAPVKSLAKATQLALANNKLNIATRVVI